MCSKETPRSVNSSDLIFVLTTTDDIDEARKLAEQLVDEKLAACVSISPPVLSIYRWGDKIEKEDEFMLLIKTVKTNYQRIEGFIKKNHSYDVPEILCFPVQGAEKDYGNWLRENTGSPGKGA